MCPWKFIDNLWGVILSSNHIRAVGIELGLWNSGQLFRPTTSSCWNFRTFYRWIRCSFMYIVIVSILKKGNPEGLCFCVCYAVCVYACTHSWVHMCEYTLSTCDSGHSLGEKLAPVSSSTIQCPIFWGIFCYLNPKLTGSASLYS